MRRILTLGVSAMSLAALSAAGVGCTAGEEEDDPMGGPGGIVNVLVTSAGAPAGGTGTTDSIGNYAEFWSEVNETPQSQRDIQLDTCVPLAATQGTSFMPTYLDVGDTVNAVSGGSTLTYLEDQSGGIFYYADAVPGAPDDAEYAIDIDTVALGAVTVPAIPQPVTVANRVVSWTTMGADDVYVVVVDGATFTPYVCHTTDDGSFDFGALVTATSGYVAVTGANYAEADLNGRTVTLIGQAGDPGLEIFDVPFGP